MPALTRAAARRMTEQPVSFSATDVGIRRVVSQKQDDVWKSRGGVDAYTLMRKGEVIQQSPQVDHCLEIQLVEFALADACVNLYGGGCRLASTQGDVARACEWFSKHMNESKTNLNVTTSRVNQKKRGPFTALLNRLQQVKTKDAGYTLRNISLEQLARQGRARELLLDGTWCRIEKQVCISYDSLHDMSDGNVVGEETLNRLHCVLENAGCF